MKHANLGFMNDNRNNKSHGKHPQPMQCELCGAPLSGKTFHDVRSNTALKGKGKVLCSKCYGILLKMPATEALEALNKASEAETHTP